MIHETDRSRRPRARSLDIVIACGVFTAVLSGFFWAVLIPRVDGAQPEFEVALSPPVGKTAGLLQGKSASGSDKDIDPGDQLSPVETNVSASEEATASGGDGVGKPEDWARASGLLAYLRDAEEAGEGVFVVPEVLTLLMAMEHSVHVGDHGRFSQLAAKLRNLMEDDLTVVESLFGLVRIWPWEPEVSGFFSALVELLANSDDPSERERLYAIFREKEARMRESRIVETSELLRSLDVTTILFERRKVLAFLTKEDLSNADVLERVMQIARDGESDGLRIDAIKALRIAHGEERLAFLIDLFRSTDVRDVRSAVALSLSMVRDERVESLFLDLMGDEFDMVVKLAAARGLGAQPTSPEVVAALDAALHRETDLMLLLSLIHSASSHSENSRMSQHLIGFLTHSSADLRAMAAIGLWRSNLPQVEHTLEQVAANDPSKMVRTNAERALRVRRLKLRG